MPFEIERKFLVAGEGWREGARGERYTQGYLPVEGRTVVRIRIAGPKAFVTIKGEPEGIVRPEFEYPIPVDDAETMLRLLCRRPLIEKTRYDVVFAGRRWVVDEFTGENTGLVLAEIELGSPDETVELPPWVGKDVTGDPRYLNVNLVNTPQGAASPGT